VNAILRAKALLADPFGEWTRIAQEPDDPVYLLGRYVAVLALVPAVFGFIGACAIGVIVPGAGTVRAPILDGCFGAFFSYAATIVTVVVLAAVVNILAPFFGGHRDFDSAFKLAAYSYTPVWLTGVFLVLPGLRFLVLTGFYGAYVLLTGLPRLMKTPEQQSQIFAGIVVICACALTLIAAVVERTVFGQAGI
jgi:hypothetical protein